jgi:hypothetical protein
MTDQINALMDKLNAMRGQTTMPPPTGRKKTRRATTFAVYRSGVSVNWECSGTEIAEDTGLGASTVFAACKRMGWKLTHGPTDKSDQMNRPSLVSMMSNPYAGNAT